ncbi:MAG: homoserine O-succinyltransferase [Alphaproteobacteria bacterium]|nr:homoserine O-succinyltransferase [Alphaproteobacteria bacterium]
MPLVAYNDLPTFDRLKKEGRTILPAERAQHQDIREMHIGFLNMMPDAALQATERQFFRLVGESNQIAQLYIHPFTLPEIERGAETQAYISQYYEPFEKLQDEGLDALIITGASPKYDNLDKEIFWNPLIKVMDWAWNNVTSTMCSCLATHAVMQFKYNQRRSALEGGKLWGVYRHRVMDRTHPLVRNMNTVFDVPHSRFNQISTEQFKQAGMKILVESKDAGTHLAVSPDGFRLICMQGHPEYDTVSLMKEYQRDLKLYEDGKISSKPALPQNYCEQDFMQKISGGDLEDCLENTWRDSARSILASWIGLVYQVTNLDRKKQFMDGVDPDNPLGI